MKIAIVHKHDLGSNFVMPHYLSTFGVKTVYQRILSGATWAYRNHKAYAEKHNYVFIDDHEPWYDSKPPDWAIWQAVLRALKDKTVDVDWIFITVNDIFFVNFEKRLEYYLRNVEPNQFLCTGEYVSDINWMIANARTDTWKYVTVDTYYPYHMISAWTHFIRKCDEAIDFISMIDRDQRHRTVERFYNHSSCGDEYMSVWYNNYPEYQQYWHLFSTHEHIRIPGNNKTAERWNTHRHLIPDTQSGDYLMIFGTCAVSIDETTQLVRDYTIKAVQQSTL